LNVLTSPPATPTGAALAQDLHDARVEIGDRAALYVPAGNAAFWNLVIDCDGKSLYPVATAGLAQINGYVPRQADCPQEIALRGFGTPPDQRPEDTRESICLRAREKGFDRVVWLEGADRPGIAIDCAQADQ
jgi:hypothetical protein